MAQFTEKPMLTMRFMDALDWAFKIHVAQVRKDGTPYINHLLQVCGLVLEAGGTEDQAIAALLHDAVEDCDVDLGDIEQRFGSVVRRIVRAVTLDGGPEVSIEAQTLAYCQNIQICPEAILVSAADTLHNLRGYARGAAEMKPRHQYLYNHVWPIYLAHLGDNSLIVGEMWNLIARMALENDQRHHAT